MPHLPTGLIVLSLAMVLSPRMGAAEPPANADPALRPWFELLKQPGTGVSCCSISDCRPVQYRLAIDGYEALIDSRMGPCPAGQDPAASAQSAGARGSRRSPRPAARSIALYRDRRRREGPRLRAACAPDRIEVGRYKGDFVRRSRCLQASERDTPAERDQHRPRREVYIGSGSARQRSPTGDSNAAERAVPRKCSQHGARRAKQGRTRK